MRSRKISLTSFLLILTFFVLPTLTQAAPGEQYRRWVNDKTYTCTQSGGMIDVILNNQNVEFANLPADAQFTLNYIDNGVVTPTGPYTVEQTSGTHSYGSFAESFSAYPLTFEFRIDTLIDGVVVYQSSLIINCSGDVAVPQPVTPTDVVPAGAQFRGWVNNKTYTCTQTVSGVNVVLSNQDVDVVNLSSGDTFTLNYIDNGVNTPSGPFPVEANGRHLYGSFLEPFPSYPLTFEFRIDTFVSGVLVWQSSIIINCSADTASPQVPTIVSGPYVPSVPGGGTASAIGCAAVLPSSAVQGRMLATEAGLFEPRADATTDVTLPGGSSWWIIAAQDGFYRLWIACEASPVWVPASSMGPNYETGGAPLPDAGS